MTNPDEPLFPGEDDAAPVAAAGPAVRDRIRRLAREQSYAVLCLQGQGQPYGALVAFAFTDDLRHAVFATPVSTRKYRLLTDCDRVALLVDNRPEKANALMEVEAVTVTGRARQIERGAEFARWAGLLVARHPYLEQFAQAATCALFCVDVVRFLHVMRFQEVRQWIPTNGS